MKTFGRFSDAHTIADSRQLMIWWLKSCISRLTSMEAFSSLEWFWGFISMIFKVGWGKVPWVDCKEKKSVFIDFFKERRVLVFIGVLTLILAFVAQMLLLTDGSSPKLQAIVMCSVQNVTGVFYAWLILVLECGTFKWIDRFVMHKIWKPLGKLTFCIYMVHPVILICSILKHTKMIDYSAVYVVRFENTARKFWLIFHYISDKFVLFTDSGNFRGCCCRASFDRRTIHQTWQTFFNIFEILIQQRVQLNSK